MNELPKSAAILQSGIDANYHTAAQVYVSLNNEVVADTAVGVADLDTQQALTPDHLVLWLSATKAVGAVAIAQLWEQGKVDLDAPVAEIIPEFAQNGKASITLRHILTHTGGFRNVGIVFVEPDFSKAVRQVCEAPIEEGWVIGETAGYHPRSSWYILGELVHRVDGRLFWRYVREAIFEPLGMHDSWIGMDPDAYRNYGDRVAPVYATEKGACMKTDMTSEQNCVACFPAGNGCGPMRELGAFYEMLLNRGERGGVRLLKPETVDEFTHPRRVGKFDETFRHKMDWSLGFITDSKQYDAQTVPYGYGLHCSPRTFGHGGRQTVCAFADPDRGLVVAVMFNGMPGEPRHNKRIRDFATALYEDLGLID